MITTLKQAKQVQKRRVEAKKTGFAKAVRRFLQREHKDDYRAAKSSLTAMWDKKKVNSEDYNLAA